MYQQTTCADCFLLVTESAGCSNSVTFIAAAPHVGSDPVVALRATLRCGSLPNCYSIFRLATRYEKDRLDGELVLEYRSLGLPIGRLDETREDVDIPPLMTTTMGAGLGDRLWRYGCETKHNMNTLTPGVERISPWSERIDYASPY